MIGALAVALAVAAAPPGTADAAALDRLPPLVLWSWDRHDDLSGLELEGIAVAALVGTVVLHDDRVEVIGRRRALVVPDRVPLVPVVRVESRARTLDPSRAAEVAARVVRLLDIPADVVQIDFDSARSERAFHLALLREIRARLAPHAALTVTALASWCAGDRWLDGAPVTAAVPMLFRMGTEDARHRARSADMRDRPPECRLDVGLALDEPVPGVTSKRRWIFPVAPWSSETVAAARAHAP